MGGDKRPAFQFYPDDWVADADLMSCSAAAQGLWIYMLCVMHRRTPYGHLVTRSGEPMPLEKLAKLFRSTVSEIDELLAELGSNEVYSQTDQGVIYSRRMVYDYEVYLERQESGRKGGRVSASKRLKAPLEIKSKAPLENDSKGGVGQDSNTPTPSPPPTPSPTPEEKHTRVEFDQFWKLQIRKETKAEARRIWKGDKNTSGEIRMSAEETHEALRVYPFHRLMWEREARDKDKIPHPRTWLYQRRWEDEIDGLVTRADLAAAEVENKRRTLVKHIIEYKAAVLEAALELSPEIQTLAKDHATNLNELVKGGDPKGIMNGLFYQMHDLFLAAVFLALDDEQRIEISTAAEGVAAGVVPEAIERTTATVTRKLVQELTGLPDPLDFGIAEEDIP